MDHQIGQMVQALEQCGILDNTIVIFTSDNGMNLGQHGIWGKGNGTFPQNMYDSSVKVPFIAMWKNHTVQNAVCRELFSHYDVLPTLCELTGTKCETKQVLPGRSFAPWLKNPALEQNAPVVVFDEYGPVRMIRNHEIKLVLRYPYGPNELYDLVKDPEEERNLYGDSAYEDMVLSMTKEMDAWFEAYSDKMFDARCEAVTGTGQHARPGRYASLNDRYGPIPAFAKEK